AERAAGRQDLGPPGRPAAAGQVDERVLVKGRNNPCEPAVVDPGSIEPLHVADAVGEEDPWAMPVEAVVNEWLVRRFALGAGQGSAVQDQAVEQAMARGGESDEAAAPDGLVAEGRRVEAGGQLAAIAEPDADALGDRH